MIEIDCCLYQPRIGDPRLVKVWYSACASAALIMLPVGFSMVLGGALA
jgi:hypothetical protein